MDYRLTTIPKDRSDMEISSDSSIFRPKETYIVTEGFHHHLRVNKRYLRMVTWVKEISMTIGKSKFGAAESGMRRKGSA